MYKSFCRVTIYGTYAQLVRRPSHVEIPCTNWSFRLAERETGLEPATLCLGTSAFTSAYIFDAV